MPTYEYACDGCEHRFERFQSISARALKKCPKCGHNTLRRLIGAGAGVIFKGSGFYETDYRSESYKKAAEAEKKARSESGDKSAKKEAGAQKDAAPAKAAPAPAKRSSKPPGRRKDV